MLALETFSGCLLEIYVISIALGCLSELQIKSYCWRHNTGLSRTWPGPPSWGLALIVSVNSMPGTKSEEQSRVLLRFKAYEPQPWIAWLNFQVFSSGTFILDKSNSCLIEYKGTTEDNLCAALWIKPNTCGWKSHKPYLWTYW